MMELIEAAIPVIQHLPTAGAEVADAARQNLGNPGAVQAVAVDAERDAEDRRDVAAADDQAAADQTALAAHIERTLERLRSGQASLLSGAILQQYQRQVVFEVQNSRPATRVLDVQG
jgi:hypothetical protein